MRETQAKGEIRRKGVETEVEVHEEGNETWRRREKS
jgi:hypothetical protein